MSLYETLDETDRVSFSHSLASEFSVDPTVLRYAAEDYIRNPAFSTLAALQDAAEAPRQELFRRLNGAPGGTGFLVALRSHLLKGLQTRAAWMPVETDLAHVLRDVFNRGHLEFRRLHENSPEPVLERLMRYEAVHEIHGWSDMRRRLAADRRCYAFFHPAWPDEPLIFTEVALTRGMADKVQPLVDPTAEIADERACDSAIFYSITNCQAGLRGFAFGNALIGRAVDDLRTELPQLRTFATLSPIPGFRSWLSGLRGSAGITAPLAGLLSRLDEPRWFEDGPTLRALETALVPLCAHYLLQGAQGTEPTDPVARFHLSNGARLRRVNWLSDLSPAGLARSGGLTANYVYRGAELERNCEEYARTRKASTTRQLERLSTKAAAMWLPREEPSMPLAGCSATVS